MSTQKNNQDTNDRSVTPYEEKPVDNQLLTLRERELQLKLWSLRLLIGHRIVKITTVVGTAIFAVLKIAGLS